MTWFTAVAFIAGCFIMKEKEISILFKCNVKYIHVRLLSTSPPAAHDARWLLWSSACFQLASLFIFATSGSHCLLRWHQWLGLITRLQCHLSSGTSSMLISGTCCYPCSATGTPCDDKATEPQRLRVYFKFIWHSALKKKHRRAPTEILATSLSTVKGQMRWLKL